MDRAAWSALANLDHTGVVQQIHEDNIRAAQRSSSPTPIPRRG